jgi:hypothetical protein
MPAKKKIEGEFGIFRLIIALLTAFGGAVGYMHTSFTKEARTDKIEAKLEREVQERAENTTVIRNILCKMAIKQQLEDAAGICTRKPRT